MVWIPTIPQRPITQQPTLIHVVRGWQRRLTREPAPAETREPAPTDNASLTPTFHNPRASNADMSDGSGIPKTSEELRRQAVSRDLITLMKYWTMEACVDGWVTASIWRDESGNHHDMPLTMAASTTSKMTQSATHHIYRWKSRDSLRHGLRGRHRSPPPGFTGTDCKRIWSTWTHW